MLVSYISLGELRYRLSLIFFSKEILVFCELRILLSCFQRTFDWCIRISKMNRIGLQSLVFNLLYCVALWYPSIIVVYSYDYQIHILLCENSLNNYRPNIFFFFIWPHKPRKQKVQFVRFAIPISSKIQGKKARCFISANFQLHSPLWRCSRHLDNENITVSNSFNASRPDVGQRQKINLNFYFYFYSLLFAASKSFMKVLRPSRNLLTCHKELWK